MPVLPQDFLRLLTEKLRQPASQLLDYGAGLLMPHVDPEVRRELLAQSGADLDRLLSYLPSGVTDSHKPFIPPPPFRWGEGIEEKAAETGRLSPLEAATVLGRIMDTPGRLLRQMLLGRPEITTGDPVLDILANWATDPLLLGSVSGPVKAARLEALRRQLPETARSYGYSSKTPKLRPREATEMLSILREPGPSLPTYLSYKELRPQTYGDRGGVKALRWKHVNKFEDIPTLGWGGEAGAAAHLPIPRRDLPPILYHVTTRGPKVRESGQLRGSRVEGGLGGLRETVPSPHSGVSFTADRKDALLIQRDLQRTIALARGEAHPSDFLKWAEEDARFGRMDAAPLKEAAQSAMENFKTMERFNREGIPGIREGAVNTYRQRYLPAREMAGGPKDPLLLGNWREWAKLNPIEVEIVAVRSRDLPEGALVRSGGDIFLREVRVHADIPLKGAVFFPKPFPGKP